MKTNNVLPNLLIVLFLLCSIRSGGAQEFKNTEEGWSVRGSSYEATIDQEGNFRRLTVDGTPFLGKTENGERTLTGGAFPGAEPADSIERDGKTVRLKRNGVRVEYTFDQDGFTVKTGGGQVYWALSDQVRACIGQDAVVPPSGSKGDIHTIAAGEAGVRFDKPYHVIGGELRPSFLTRGGDEADAFEARFTCGVEVTPFELVTPGRLTPAGQNWKKTARYEPGETPVMTLKLSGFAGEAVDLNVQFRVVNHPHNGETVRTKRKSVTVPAEESTAVTAELPVNEPGLYWTYAALEKDGKHTLQRRRGFIYDHDHFKPPLTRPEDFDTFWSDTLSEMREIPFEANRSKNEELSDENYIHYDLTLNDFNGDRYTTFLRVPRGEGPFNAEVLTSRNDAGDPPVKKFEKLKNQDPGVGMWQRGAERVRVGARLPNGSRFRRWKGRNDNNMLHSYLRVLRMMDYLRSLDKVDHLFLFGASRSGPIMLVAGALSPERVAAVNVHVPTSCGISWKEPPYKGWGRPPSRTEEGLRIAAYFDPVNHAPDLEVPVIMDGGFYDGLAPAPGIVAFYNPATKAPFRRCHIEQGPHGYFKLSHRDEMRKALREHLKKTKGSDPVEK